MQELYLEHVDRRVPHIQYLLQYQEGQYTPFHQGIATHHDQLPLTFEGVAISVQEHLHEDIYPKIWIRRKDFHRVSPNHTYVQAQVRPLFAPYLVDRSLHIDLS